jgi:hypothetical protein
VRAGRGAALAFTDPWRSLSYAALQRATARQAEQAAGTQLARLPGSVTAIRP